MSRDDFDDDDQYDDDGITTPAFFDHELARLQTELTKSQYWVADNDLQVIVVV